MLFERTGLSPLRSNPESIVIESNGVAAANFARRSEPLLSRKCTFVCRKEETRIVSLSAEPWSIPGIEFQPGGIDSSESIPGLLKRLQIRAQGIGSQRNRFLGSLNVYKYRLRELGVNSVNKTGERRKRFITIGQMLQVDLGAVHHLLSPCFSSYFGLEIPLLLWAQLECWGTCGGLMNIHRAGNPTGETTYP